MFTYRVSGHQHRLADERRADLKVLQPAVDVIVGVEGAGRKLSGLTMGKHQRINVMMLLNAESSFVSRPLFTMMWILAFPFWMMKVPPRARLCSG